MPKQLSDSTKSKIEGALKKYPEPPAALLPVMNLVEKEIGVIDGEAEQMIADICSTTRTKVHEAWTFYHMFARKPRGKYHFRVCHNISCSLLGAENIIDLLLQEIGLEGEGTTEDGLFSFERVECLAACGNAPAMLVNEDWHEDLTEEKIRNLIQELRRKEGKA